MVLQRILKLKSFYNWQWMDKSEESNLSKTITIGSCSEHRFYGTLKIGATKTEWSIDKILKALFWMPSNSTARRDDYV